MSLWILPMRYLISFCYSTCSVRLIRIRFGFRGGDSFGIQSRFCAIDLSLDSDSKWLDWDKLEWVRLDWDNKMRPIRLRH